MHWVRTHVAVILLGLFTVVNLLWGLQMLQARLTHADVQAQRREAIAYTHQWRALVDLLTDHLTDVHAEGYRQAVADTAALAGNWCAWDGTSPDQPVSLSYLNIFHTGKVGMSISGVGWTFAHNFVSMMRPSRDELLAMRDGRYGYPGTDAK